MAKKIMSRGVGPSKLHRDPHAPDPYAHLRGLHVGGRPIEDLPEEMVARLSYQHTDESIAERNAGKVESALHVRAAGGERARVTASVFDEQVHERRDFRRDHIEIGETPDPIKELTEAHIQPGMAPKFLSPRMIARRGMRGYEAVKGSNGEPVKLGQMLLGQMPAEQAQARREHFRGKGKERLAAIEDQHQERQRELVGD